MTNFSNPVVGGSGILKRPAVQSPNYVAGISGWTVNKDGSAEFNDATFRGTIVITSGDALFVYNPTPGLGNLVLAISSNGGIDAYGNSYYAGVTVSTVPTGGNGGFTSSGAGGGPDVNLRADNSGNGIFQVQGELTISSAGSLPGTSPRITLIADEYKFSPGPVGGYYFERVNMPAQVFVSAAAFTPIVNLVALVPPTPWSHYGSAWNLAAGLWTCPVDGVYAVDVSIAPTAWVAGSRLLASVNLNGAPTATQLKKVDEASTTGVTFMSVVRDFVAGDTLQVNYGQVTGVNQTLVTGGVRSYIAIRKAL